MSLTLHLFLTALMALSLYSCDRWVRIQVTDPSLALIPLEAWEVPSIDDDLDHESLERAARQSLIYLEQLPGDRTFQYGPYRVSAREVRETLLDFLDILNRARAGYPWAKRVQEEFLWFQAAGRDAFRRVLFTGYYEPILEGSLQPDKTFHYPLYGRPPDLMEVDLGPFRETLSGERIVGRLDGHRIVPYYSRAEIDGQGVLAGKGLELVWLKDPVDAFFLHIQGSGQVRLPDGRRLHVNYAAKNGRPYRSIGRILIDQGSISPQRMSMQAIRDYLRDHPERLQATLFANPSYVFFRVVQEGPLGSLDVVLTPGRSIATDSRLFPKAGLAFVRAERPLMDDEGRITRWRPFSRFVLNQDTGGAIRGAGRVDLFCGAGSQAEVTAGHLQHYGRLYFLLRKGAESLSTER